MLTSQNYTVLNRSKIGYTALAELPYGIRSLWLSVVIQALRDISEQSTNSMIFSEAVAFFTGSGQWARARTTVGDFLSLHRDDVEAIGRRGIEMRLAGQSMIFRAELPRRPSQYHQGGPRIMARDPAPTIAAVRRTSVQRTAHSSAVEVIENLACYADRSVENRTRARAAIQSAPRG